VKREIYRPQRDFYWVPAGLAVAIFALYHVLALLIAMLRALRREQAPERASLAEVRRGN
jgi:Ca-activated chloride channel family protein